MLNQVKSFTVACPLLIQVNHSTCLSVFLSRFIDGFQVNLRIEFYWKGNKSVEREVFFCVGVTQVEIALPFSSLKRVKWTLKTNLQQYIKRLNVGTVREQVAHWKVSSVKSKSSTFKQTHKKSKIKTPHRKWAKLHSIESVYVEKIQFTVWIVDTNESNKSELHERRRFATWQTRSCFAYNSFRQ